MSELKFDLREWQSINEKVKELLKNKEQWDYLFDMDKTFDSYDPDSSEVAWDKVYRKLYTSNDWKFWDAFEFQNLICERNRLVAEAKSKEDWTEYFSSEHISKQWKIWVDDKKTIIRFGGETDFNFGKDKYEFYKKLIEKEFSGEERVAYKCKLVWCKKRIHSWENFSLMFIPGGMNNLKGRHLDRIDKFIYILDKYFSERKEQDDKNDEYLKKILRGDEKCKWGLTIFSGVSGKKDYKEKCAQALYQYLSLFDDINDYCEKIYKMDSGMVKELIELGKIGEEKESKFDGKAVVRLMDLAECYWQKKHELISKRNPIEKLL